MRLAALIALAVATTVAPAQTVSVQTIRTDRLGRVLEPAACFTVGESPWVVARLDGVSAGDRLKVRWVSESGDKAVEVLVEERKLEAGATEATAGLDWKTPPAVGRYAVEVALNDRPPVTARFTVAEEPKAQVVTFRQLAYRVGRDGQSTGTSTRGTVTVTRDPRNLFSVGLFESTHGAVGASWRASGWVAPLVAYQITDAGAPNRRVAYDLERDFTDGPSAGALTAVAILAAIRGETIKPEATMTGTINPDGTIGPVGGIRYKIDAAADAGVTLVLIPAGQRVERDTSANVDTDLVEYGKAKGVRVKEVGDVHSAYKLLVGQELPHLADAETPSIESTAARTVLGKETKDWLARFRGADDLYSNRDAKTPALTAQVMAARRQAESAEKLGTQGLPGAAWAKAHRAAVLAELAKEQADLLAVYKHGSPEKVREHLTAELARLQKRLTVCEEKLTKVELTTSEALSAALTAWSWFVKASANVALARTLAVAGPKETAEQEAERVLRSKSHLTIANVYIDTAYAYVKVADIPADKPLPRDVPLAAIADLFNVAADANLALFESVSLVPGATASGQSLQDVREKFAQCEPMYAEALHFQAVVKGLARDTHPNRLIPAVLGRAVWGYSTSAALIAKYYSLLAKTDGGRVTGFENERAVMLMLDNADAQAKRALTLLRNRKVETTACVVLYEAARQLRDGTPEEKFDALVTYWMAFTQARAIAYLTRE